MDLWLLPLRMTQAMFAVGAGMNRDLTSDAMAAAEDIENRTTDVLEAAEEKISQMDEMPDRVIADPGALVR
jgi:hypothetical protein